MIQPYPVDYHEQATPGRAALVAALLAPPEPLVALRRLWAPRTGQGAIEDVMASEEGQA